MLWMLVASVALVGLLGVRLYQKFTRGGGGTVKVDDEAEAAHDAARLASREVRSAQARAVRAQGPAAASDLDLVKAKREDFEKSEARLKALLDLLHQKGFDDSPGQRDVVKKWLQVKFWILDADDFLDTAKEGRYGGFQAPLLRLEDRIRDSQQELKKVHGSLAEIQAADGAVRASAIARLKTIEEAFAGYAEDLTRLEDYVKTGLTKPDLTAEQIPELEALHEEASKAVMGRQQARTLRSQIAAP
jgi:hypothetical protein